MPTVAELERISAESWRGLHREPFGDWLLRAGGGFTGRANSVLVVGDPPGDLPDAVAAVSRWYAERGLRPRAQVPLPGAEAADAAFAAAGWSRDEDVLVLSAALAGWPAPSVPVALADEPDEDWLTGYRYRGSALPPVAREVLLAADDPAFATVRLDPAPAPPAAVARGVVVDGWLVVTAVTVDERHRRRGLAWPRPGSRPELAKGGQDGVLHLQVAAANASALALYARLGFAEHHRYHYRVAPSPS